MDSQKLLAQGSAVPMQRISVIIPALNEAGLIVQTLQVLQPLRRSGHEVILVDGGSDDATPLLSKPLVDHVIQAPRGRARQLNAGSHLAHGDILLFLHADTLLPSNADHIILQGIMKYRKTWGRFDVKLTGNHILLRLVETLMNWRSRLTGIATGDQAIFVSRSLFQFVGGFPEIDLMEDIALSKRLKCHQRPLCLSQRVTTSSRRWEMNGILRTILLMWSLRLAYTLGADPRRLAHLYARPQ